MDNSDVVYVDILFCGISKVEILQVTKEMCFNVVLLLPLTFHNFSPPLFHVLRGIFLLLVFFFFFNCWLLRTFLLKSWFSLERSVAEKCFGYSQDLTACQEVFKVSYFLIQIN